MNDFLVSKCERDDRIVKLSFVSNSWELLFDPCDGTKPLVWRFSFEQVFLAFSGFDFFTHMFRSGVQVFNSLMFNLWEGE